MLMVLGWFTYFCAWNWILLAGFLAFSIGGAIGLFISGYYLNLFKIRLFFQEFSKKKIQIGKKPKTKNWKPNYELRIENKPKPRNNKPKPKRTGLITNRPFWFLYYEKPILLGHVRFLPKTGPNRTMLTLNCHGRQFFKSQFWDLTY